MSLRSNLKSICFCFCMAGALFTTQDIIAQSGKGARTEAVTSLEVYRTNSAKTEELKNAQIKIDKSIQDAEQALDPKTWRYKGAIYTAIADNDKVRAQYPKAAIVAYEAWIKSLELEETKLAQKGKSNGKIPAKTEFKEGFEAVSTSLFNSAVEALNASVEKGFEDAYPYFKAILDMPVAAKAIFGDKAPTYRFKELDAKRLGGLSAMYVGKFEEGEAVLKPLLNAATTEEKIKIEIYNHMAKAAIDNQQMAKAREYITEGRKKYPKDQSLLRTEISLAIAERRLQEVEAQLDMAVKENPNDAELIFVMGSLNDELFREKIRPAERFADLDANNEKEGLERFKKAAEYYAMAVKANPKHFSSLYSLGVLHVNYANYGYKKQEVEPKESKWAKLSEDAINKALEYLHQAEAIAPTDKLVLEALQKLYAIKGDSAKYELYKNKLK